MRSLLPSAPPANSVSVRDRLNSTLRDCHALITHLFATANSLLSGRANASPTQLVDEVVEKVLTRQTELRNQVDELIEHQRLNSEINRLVHENAVEEAKLSKLSSSLREGEILLHKQLSQVKCDVGNRQNRPVSVDEVISYGTKIGASVSAPAGWTPNQPLGNFLHPAPGYEMMRKGRLASISAQVATASQKEDGAKENT